MLNRRVGLSLSLVGVDTLDVDHVGQFRATSMERATGPFGCLRDERVVVLRVAFSSGLLLSSSVTLESALGVFGEKLQSRGEDIAGEGEDADEEDDVVLVESHYGCWKVGLDVWWFWISFGLMCCKIDWFDCDD